MSDVLELDDIQGIVARGYGKLAHAAFLMFAADDGPSARTALQQWLPRVTPAIERPEDVALNLAVTGAGVTALTGRQPADGFAEQFVNGMATPYRSRLLGDQDEDDPARWRWGGPANEAVHVLALVYAASEPALAQQCRDLTEQGQPGLRLVERLDTEKLSRTEPFGFHDGISQPLVHGLGENSTSGEIAAGEFVLGYPNEYGLLTERPLAEASDDPAGILPRAADGTGLADLGRNGSYLVVRQLEQDIDGFRAFLDDATRGTDGQVDPHARDLLAAKMVGRWPSGAPLVLSPDRDDPALGDANDFHYQALDPRGIACPLGAHVRRTNPRDALEPDPGTDGSLEINRRHRLLRRGRSYNSAASGERGVHFLCLNANLARQFEFIQHSWVNNPAFNGMYDETDPIIGARREGARSFTTPGRPVRRRYTGLPQFVHVRGGAYFFLPGRRALRYLAGAGAD